MVKKAAHCQKNLLFDIDALDGVDELVITFDTYLNENAVMGRDYENNVELNYNNGFEVYVDTEKILLSFILAVKLLKK